MSYRPQHYELTVGTWDTDVGYNTTVANVSGNGCIEFKSVTAASDPEFEYDTFLPVSGGSPYSLFAVVQGSSTSYDVLLRAKWYDEDQTQLTGGDAYTDAYNGTLSAASSWLLIGEVFDAPADARYGKFYISKDASSAWTLYVDSIEFRRRLIGAAAKLSAYQTLPSTSTTKIQFDTEDYDFGSNYDSSTNYWFTAPETGIYTISATFLIYKTSAPSSPMAVLMYIIAAGTYYNVAIGSDTTAAKYGSSYYWTTATSMTLYLTEGDTVFAAVYHDDSGSLRANSPNSRFSVHRVE